MTEAHITQKYITFPADFCRFFFDILIQLCSAAAYFLFIRPYFLYRKSPEVLAETDGEFIYIYGKKQAKIPISAFDGAIVTFNLPFIYSNEFIAVLLVHLFSEEYGDIILDVPEYGSFKLRFVSRAKETSEELLQFINASINRSI